MPQLEVKFLWIRIQNTTVRGRVSLDEDPETPQLEVEFLLMRIQNASVRGRVSLDEDPECLS